MFSLFFLFVHIIKMNQINQMNPLMLVVVALVVFCYFGGNYCPAILKKNKEMLLGVVIGLVLSSFFGVRLLEGFNSQDMMDCMVQASALTGKEQTEMIQSCDEQWALTRKHSGVINYATR
jgi:hypothetical protein